MKHSHSPVRSVFFAVLFGLIPFHAFAASDVSSDVSTNTQSSVQAVTSTSSITAASNAGNLISGAIGSGFSGGSVGSGFTTAANKTGNKHLETGLSAGDEFIKSDNAKKIGVWTQGDYSIIDREETGLEMDGNSTLFVVGADYQITDHFKAGLAGAWEKADLTTTYNLGSVDSNGFSVIPYIGYDALENWTVDAAVGYSQVSYETMRSKDVSGQVTGSFNGKRVFASANATGDYKIGDFGILPKAGVFYLKERQEQFNESNGELVEASTLNFGRFTFGSKVGYAGFTEYGIPYVKAYGEYDFKQPDSVLKSNNHYSNKEKFGGVFGLGYEIETEDGLTASLEGSTNSVGRSDLDIWNFTFRLRSTF